MQPQAIEQTVRQIAPGRMTTTSFMGWKPDLPDHHDFSFAKMVMRASEASGFPVRAEVAKLHKHPIFDQGIVGSCVGQSVSVLHALERKVTPRSALFAYWHARALIGETGIDAGAYIRDGIKVTNVEGVPRDDLWPDVPVNVFIEPSVKAEADAEKRRIFNYYRLDAEPGVQVARGQAYRACLASGHCFVIGFTVYGNFWQTGYNGGMAPMPAGQPDGGHAVLVYGYDDDFANSPKGKALAAKGVTPPRSAYMVRNSWGKDWGDGGNFYMPTQFLESPYLADDAWTVRKK